MKEKGFKDGKKRSWIFLLVFFSFSILTVILGILCLDGASYALSQKQFLLWATVIAAGISVLCGFCVWFTLSGKERLTKTFLSLYILVLFSLLLLFVLQKTGFFEVVRSSEKLREYLQRAGIWMPVFYILIQFLQVVILPIPSVVSTVAGVALFGAFWAMVYSLAGILLGSLLAFFIGRKLGYRAVNWMVGEETLKKWQKKLKGKDNLFLTIMFVLPLFPDDILCFLAGLSSMTTRYFIVMIFICRFLAIAGTCYSIDFIPFNTWWGITLWILFLIGIVVVFVLVYKNMDRIQNAIKSWKKKKRKK